MCQSYHIMIFLHHSYLIQAMHMGGAMHVGEAKATMQLRKLRPPLADQSNCRII